MYHWVVSEEEKHTEQNEEALAKNFSLNTINGTLTKLGDQLVSPGLVLAWLFGVLGISDALIGALVPIRKSFALVPQLFISGFMRKFKTRKWFWVAGAFSFGLGILLMIPAVLLLSESAAIGWVLLGLLGFASLSRGVSSVAFTDVVGKTILSGERGRLLAARATSGGLLALLAGLFLRLYSDVSSDIYPLLFLIGGGAFLWMVGSILVIFMIEPESDQENARNVLEEISAGYRLLKENVNLQKFVWARGFLLVAQLSTPFYVLYARQFIGAEFGNLAIFVIVISGAKVVSSPLWGGLSDQSSKKGMIYGGTLAVLVGILALSINLLPVVYQNVYILGGLLLLLGFAQAGIRLGRKTYFLDIAPEDERPLFSAVINLIIGILTLLSGLLGIIIDIFNIQILIAIVTIVPVLGVILSKSLTDTGEID